MKKIAVVCDSSADITNEEAQRLGLHVFNMPVIVEGQEYIDSVNYTTEQLKEALDNNCKVATSQPSPGHIEQVWDELLQTYDEIIFLPISEKLSGFYSTAKMLSMTDKYRDKVEVIRSRYVAYAQVHLCLEIKQLISEGYSISEIARKVEHEVTEEAIIVPYDLNTFKNSGRVSPAVAALAGLLKIQVVLKFEEDGKIEQIDKVRTLSKAYEIMIKEAINVENKDDYHWGIVHSDYLEEAEKIQKKLQETHQIIADIHRIRTIIRAHTGNKTIAIYRIKKLKK